jgi:metallophosphoesterase superfamily enzyme
MSRRGFLAATCALAARAAGAAEVQDTWEGVGRVVAIGDVHGDKDAFVAVLKMAGMIDAQERWIGEQAHLVQVGDVPARGPQTRQAFDLLMKLEAQAAAAGGKVHAIIGNHDAGVIYGDLRHITPEEFREFGKASRQSIRR